MKLFLITLLIPLYSFATQEKWPEGWGGPTQKQLSQPWRKDHFTKYASIAADFDGDKKTDFANLLVSSNNSKFGLYVKLGNGKINQIIHEDEIKYLDAFGIVLLAPQKLKTACGKGCYDCEKGESEVLNLERSSIKFFKEDSAESVFWLDLRSQKFVRTWISD